MSPYEISRLGRFLWYGTASEHGESDAPQVAPDRCTVRQALARFGRKALDSLLIMRSVGLKFALRDHFCLVHTFVFVRRCMGQGTSHARCASEEPRRLVAYSLEANQDAQRQS